MTLRLFAPHAFDGERFVDNLAIEVDAAGTIVAAEAGAEAAGATRLDGLVAPGMPDLHSHAFQRAMVGLTQRAGPAADDFWTWREVMYRFVGHFSPEDAEAIAAGLYLDLVRHGFTTVGEFHYLHNAPDGGAYADPAEMAERMLAAAGEVGMAMTLLPVLYQSGSFGGQPAKPGQRRFLLATDTFLTLVETLRARHGANPNLTVGVAPHSLRAVGPQALAAVIAGITALDPAAPIHIHAAEQTGEVNDCLAWSGLRPVEWLADHAGLDQRWCLIHATHTTPGEKQLVARAGAVIGLCPTTEADLGDGNFDLAGFEAVGGRFGVGTDSNVCVSPATELRQLEWSQRLATRQRLVAARAEGASVGTTLYQKALAGGAQAMGRKIGRIAPGYRADLVVLDPEHALQAGRAAESALDSWLFGTDANPVKDVMIGGRFVIEAGHHRDEARIVAAFKQAMRRLVAAG